MGVFAKKDTPNEPTRPVNWDELTKAGEKMGIPGVNIPPVVTLDEQTRALLRQAGENARKALFDDADGNNE
jgi:hypothetical protein